MQQIEIRVKGHIAEHWSEWFEDFEISYHGENETVLTGSVCDQAALYGLLTKLRNLGLGLVSVTTQEPLPNTHEVSW